MGKFKKRRKFTNCDSKSLNLESFTGCHRITNGEENIYLNKLIVFKRRYFSHFSEILARSKMEHWVTLVKGATKLYTFFKFGFIWVCIFYLLSWENSFLSFCVWYVCLRLSVVSFEFGVMFLELQDLEL